MGRGLSVDFFRLLAAARQGSALWIDVALKAAACSNYPII